MRERPLRESPSESRAEQGAGGRGRAENQGQRPGGLRPLCIPILGTGFGSRLAWLADRDQDVVFVGRDDDDGRRAAHLALAVGICMFGEFLSGGMTSWRQERREVIGIERLGWARA